MGLFSLTRISVGSLFTGPFRKYLLVDLTIPAGITENETKISLQAALKGDQSADKLYYIGIHSPG